MENRRPSQNSGKPFKQRENFQKPAEKPAAYRKSQPRDDNFQPRNERFQNKDEKLAGKIGRYQSAGNKTLTKNRFTEPKEKNIKPWEKADRPRIVSDMQITDGKHYGKYLQSTASPKLRATERRMREIMFKILLRRIRAGRFLDLFAGAGTVGIEAISRGALIGTFVERSAKLCSFIKKNLAELNIKNGHGEIFEMEVVPFLKQMEKRRRVWDVIFFDPPFDADYDEFLKYLGRGVALRAKSILVIEHPSEMFFPEKIGVLNRWRVIAQDKMTLSFYERR